MSSPDLSQSLPNPHWVMPQTGQHILLGVFGGGCALFVAYCIYLGRQRRSWLPLLFAVGATLSIMLEPVADTLGNVQHPAVGQINAFTVDGQPIPWHVVIAYTWYYGLLPVILFDRFRRRGMTPALWWKIAVGAFLAVFLFEQIPAGTGMWIYYGKQPLRVGNMPMWMAFANYASVVLVALVVYRVWPILTGWRQLLVVPLVPATVLASHTAAAIPSYMVINAPPHDVSWVMLQAAGLATLGLSLLVVWLGIVFAHNLIPEVAPGAGLDSASPDRPARRGTSPERRESVPALSSRV